MAKCRCGHEHASSVGCRECDCHFSAPPLYILPGTKARPPEVLAVSWLILCCLLTVAALGCLKACGYLPLP